MASGKPSRRDRAYRLRRALSIPPNYRLSAPGRCGHRERRSQGIRASIATGALARAAGPRQEGRTLMPAVDALLADPDFYEPLSSADGGTLYLPPPLPEGWRRTQRGVWSSWTAPGDVLADQGWKIHVSSSAGNAQHVLDVVACACLRFGVSFKHLAGQRYFLAMHHKHAGRVQSGKFCALYPSTPRLAGEVMQALERDLAGVAGPYVLTDRRFGSSRCVSYRYGAFLDRSRLEPDGSRTAVLVTADGRETLDERRPAFRLPDGIADPFAPARPLPAESAESDGAARFGGYTFAAVLQHSNAGGAYRARDAENTEVFVKEARAHNGYTDADTDAGTRLEREFLLLQALHERAPGLCPAPRDHFAYWEHTYLVTEFVPGTMLSTWAVAASPLIRPEPTPEQVRDYYRRCLAIVSALGDAVARLHELGYAFGDLSPRNVLVDEQDRPRLIDFESARRLAGHASAPPPGTPGFIPPELLDPRTRDTVDPRHVDRYALSSIALALLAPLHHVADRNPAALGHLRADLGDVLAPPAALWKVATRFRPAPSRTVSPEPAQLRAEPVRWLGRLRDATANSLEALAAPEHPVRIYPTTPEGYRSNTRCVAHGTAGVLHALHAAGRDVDPAILRRLRDASLREKDDTAPGLLYGNAGIAWVLTELGEPEAAEVLLEAATGHRITRETASLGGGAAGVAMVWLSLYCRDGDERRLREAHRLLTSTASFAATGTSSGDGGWALGRAGTALALYYLAALCGELDHLERGAALLRDELAGYGTAVQGGALAFRVSDKDRRIVPYLKSGSAGYAHVLARYSALAPEPELCAALEGCLRALDIRITATPGLFDGQAGMALVLADIAELCDRPELAASARRSAIALVKHAVPHDDGARWPGGPGLRLSADLATGGAGVLLALSRVLGQAGDPLFTLDRYVAAQRVIPSPHLVPAPATA